MNPLTVWQSVKDKVATWARKAKDAVTFASLCVLLILTPVVFVAAWALTILFAMYEGARVTKAYVLTIWEPLSNAIVRKSEA